MDCIACFVIGMFIGFIIGFFTVGLLRKDLYED